MEAPLVNRIAKSKLVTIDPGKFYPSNLYVFDLKDYLYQGLILREKEFRQALEEFEWESLENLPVLVHCSNDAIIPLWAYMLVASKASAYTTNVYAGEKGSLVTNLIVERIKNQFPPENIEGGKFVIKGCAEYEISPDVYSQLSTYLTKYDARSIMFGEPCSTVPIYKKRKN